MFSLIAFIMSYRRQMVVAQSSASAAKAGLVVANDRDGDLARAA